MENPKAWSNHQEVSSRETHSPLSFSYCVQKDYIVSLAKQLARVKYEAILYLEIVLVWLTSFLQIIVFCFAGQPLKNARRSWTS